MINFQFIRKNSVYFLLLSCLLILSSTLVIEYVFNFPPCELCLYQRIPYGLILIVGLILLFFNQRKLFFLIFILMQFVTLSIAFFHSLVERGIVEYESSCTSSGEDIDNIDEHRKFLENVPIAKCNEIIFSIFNISLANFNVIISLLLITFTYAILKTNEK